MNQNKDHTTAEDCAAHREVPRAFWAAIGTSILFSVAADIGFLFKAHPNPISWILLLCGFIAAVIATVVIIRDRRA